MKGHVVLVDLKTVVNEYVCDFFDFFVQDKPEEIGRPLSPERASGNNPTINLVKIEYLVVMNILENHSHLIFELVQHSMKHRFHWLLQPINKAILHPSKLLNTLMVSCHILRMLDTFTFNISDFLLQIDLF